MKKCPFCAEEIQEEAIKCKHCFSDLKGSDKQNSASSSPMQIITKKCSNCSQKLPGEATRCHNCGSKLEEGENLVSNKPNYKCLNCGYEGQMNSYLRTNERQLIAILLFFCGIIPGLIYLLWGSGKMVCPKCKQSNIISF